jgi:hypothetical protein
MTVIEGPSDIIVPHEVVLTATTTLSTYTSGLYKVSAGTITASFSCALGDGSADCTGISVYKGHTSAFTGPVSAVSHTFQAFGATSLIGRPAPTGGASGDRPTFEFKAFVLATAIIPLIHLLC